MRIGISTSVVQRGKTGIAQYVFALLRAMLPAAKEHHFTLLVLEEDQPLFAEFQPKMDLALVPERFRPPIKNIQWHQSILPQLAKQRQLDVLHIPSYRRLMWRRPCGTVGTIHDLAPFHVRGKYDWARMFYGKVIVPRLAARQHQIIAISEATAADVRKFLKIPPDRLNVIHNGLDHERFSVGSREEARASLAREFGLDRPFFLYVARLEHPAKNHTRLIAAFEAFKKATGSSWQLVFGGSDWHGAEAIHAAIQNSPVRADIRCLGFVADAGLPTLYQGADVFVYPSLFEGFGMPPIEAMACGCPVIASTRGSLGEVVGDAAAIVDPGSTESITKQLTGMATDDALRAKYREAGLERARKFHWSRCAEQTLKVYARAKAIAA